jgi:hypothetical protein
MNGMKWIIGAALLASLSLNAADKAKVREREADRREQRAVNADIDKRIIAMNRLDNNPAARRVGMAAVSKQTAVPLPQIESEHKEHPKVGIAGLFMAHELAVHTHKPVEHFLKAHADGKSWNEQIKANGLNHEEIDAKIARIEDEMRAAK